MIVRIDDKYKYCRKGIMLIININASDEVVINVTVRSNVDFMSTVGKLRLVSTYSLNTCMQKMIRPQEYTMLLINIIIIIIAIIKTYFLAHTDK